MDSPFRIYEPDECGEDGYPHVWHKNDDHGALDALIEATLHERGMEVISALDYTAGLKHIVRQQADHRCIRCRHPFIVGKSGEMDGPHAHAKGFAAELGVSIETLDQVVIEGMDLEFVTKNLDAARRTNWSDCDDRCRHGGPMRVWVRDGDTERWEPFDPTPTACGAAVGTLLESESKAQAAWRILTVHHLNEVKRDLRWWNLVALCQRCHLLIQRKVTMEDPWPWEHTDWFRPYAAAWYALRYLDQDLDRDTTMERMDMLLALGRQEESVERMPI